MFIQFLRSIAERTPPFVMRWFFNIYPPYLGAGIRVVELSKDRRYLKVLMRLQFYNRNYVGTQFGGSIYSMTDPHYMYLLMNNLGSDYIVWDKGAHIDFLRPGKTDLIAEFRIDEELLKSIREKTQSGEKYIFDLPAQVCDRNGALIATMTKTLYVRKKVRCIGSI